MQLLARLLIEQIKSIVVGMWWCIEMQTDCRLCIRSILDLVQSNLVADICHFVSNVRGLLERARHRAFALVRYRVECLTQASFQYLHDTMSICMVMNWTALAWVLLHCQWSL